MGHSVSYPTRHLVGSYTHRIVAHNPKLRLTSLIILGLLLLTECCSCSSYRRRRHHHPHHHQLLLLLPLLLLTLLLFKHLALNPVSSSGEFVFPSCRGSSCIFVFSVCTIEQSLLQTKITFTDFSKLISWLHFH
jgi:hypothetical protein